MTVIFDASASAITADMARELAEAQGVCIRPLIRRVIDRQTDREEQVALSCGSTRETVCPPCARKAQVLRMQQCAEGWHRDQEPDSESGVPEDQVDEDHGDEQRTDENGVGDGRRVRSTRRRTDAPALPRVPAEHRTVGRVFTAPDGREYRPSMFLTLTLGSYGPIRGGVPVAPSSYDYRRAAWDAMCFPRLVDRFWQNLRRCAGYRVQYFAAIEPQRRLTPHLHAAIRGAIPREVLRRVVRATYLQLWWPPCDSPMYMDRLPVWDGSDYVDPGTGQVLPTWTQALDDLEADPDEKPVHVMRFGAQLDIAGIVAPSEQADRAVRYLTKYLTKAVAEAHIDDEGQTSPAFAAHVDRLHAELRWLPCSERCANWLRYGVQPLNAGPGLIPGRCVGKAHDRENLGLGGRRVLVSRQWSGKTLSEHRCDRASVVREALLSAGIDAPELGRMAAGVTMPDGSPRFVWTDTRPDPILYRRVLLEAVAERQRWRAQYRAARDGQTEAGGLVDGVSAAIPRPPPMAS